MSAKLYVRAPKFVKVTDMAKPWENPIELLEGDTVQLTVGLCPADMWTEDEARTLLARRANMVLNPSLPRGHKWKLEFGPVKRLGGEWQQVVSFTLKKAEAA